MATISLNWLHIQRSSFAFFKENFKRLFTLYLLICLPLHLPLLFYRGTHSYQTGHTFSALLKNARSTLLFEVPVNSLSISVIMMVTLSLLMFQREGIAFDARRFKSFFINKYGTVLLAVLICNILQYIGLVLLVIPGLYFMPVAALVVPFMIFGGAKLFEAMNSAFSAVNGNWLILFLLVISPLLIIMGYEILFLRLTHHSLFNLHDRPLLLIPELIADLFAQIVLMYVVINMGYAYLSITANSAPENAQVSRLS